MLTESATLMSEGHLVLSVRPDIAQRLAGEAVISAAADELVDSMSRIGMQLHPLHEGIDDPQSSRYFYSPAAGLDDPVAVARSLAELEGVESAYYKPPDEAP